MTNVVSLDIHGLAGRNARIRHKLNPDINVYFGLNGSGKTTLLKLIYSAIRDRPDLVAGAPYLSARIEFYSLQNDETFVRSITNKPPTSADKEDDNLVFDVVESASGDLIHYPVKSTNTGWKTRPTRTGPFAVTYLPTSRLAVQSRANIARTLREADTYDELRLDQIFAQQISQLWRRYANRALSEVRQIQESGIASILQSLFTTNIEEHEPALEAEMAYQRANDFLGRRGIGRRAAGTLASFRKRYENDSRVASVVDEIDQIERRIETAEEPRRKLESLVQRFITPGKQILFSDREIAVVAGDDEIALSSLSSGEKQLLYMMVEVINADSSVPSLKLFDGSLSRGFCRRSWSK